ncbi:MAG: GHMP kinase [Synergistaceae bacterium]|jgi:L-threonine kinase|nr:GHMP kinase [Synergistaceae bacterium]
MAKILATATLPATMGEWVQGWIGGREALVSLVVGWSGSVELCILDRGEVFLRAGEKTLRAFETAKQIFSCCGNNAVIPEDGFINVINTLPPTRGLATSTMDIAGTFAVCAAYTGSTLPDEKLFSLCAGIEPSDGIMFKGLALVDHINGKLIERLPPPPDINIVALIPSRTLDTADYRRDPAILEAVRANSSEHESAYELLKRGLSEGDATLVAKAATRSAETQQNIMPRDEWDIVSGIGGRSGAIGIAIAHSGTAMGLLFAPSNKFGAELAENMLRDAYSGPNAPKATVRRTTVSSGGFLAEKI